MNYHIFSFIFICLVSHAHLDFLTSAMISIQQMELSRWNYKRGCDLLHCHPNLNRKPQRDSLKLFLLKTTNKQHNETNIQNMGYFIFPDFRSIPYRGKLPQL